MVTSDLRNTDSSVMMTSKFLQIIRPRYLKYGDFRNSSDMATTEILQIYSSVLRNSSVVVTSDFGTLGR